MATTLSPEILKYLPAQRGWTRAEFERIAELGLFADEKLELIEGVIVEKMTQNEPHALIIYHAPRVLEKGFDEARYMVRVQLPIALGESLPEPDIAVIAGNWRQLRGVRPTSAILIIEVSDSTLDTDRTIKASLYARAGIADYWIINLPERVVEIHREPAEMADKPLGFGYRSAQVFNDTQSVAPLAASEFSIAVADLLP